jgi:hypothetical protein
MPPKKAPVKNAGAKKEKIVADKTFGMKNKNKSAKVQKYVQSVQKQVDNQFAAPPKKGKEKDELEAFIVVDQKKAEKGKERTWGCSESPWDRF